MSQFNQAMFEDGLNKAIETLQASEKVTKETLREWANKVLVATHATGQVAYMNKLIAVLTPMNKRMAILFLTHFSGFKFSEETRLFTDKHKKRYPQALIDFNKFIQDPLNNIWVWADLNVQMEQKPFTVEDISKKASMIWKNAHAANIPNGEIIKAILMAKDKDKNVVFSLDDILVALQAMGVEGDLTVEDDSILAPKNDNVGQVQATQV